MNTNSNEKETNEISQSPPLPAPEPSGHPGADPSSAPPVTAPPSLQLSFQVKLAEGAVTHMSVETAIALPFSNNASEITLLGEQVKVLFKVMAMPPVRSETSMKPERAHPRTKKRRSVGTRWVRTMGTNRRSTT